MGKPPGHTGSGLESPSCWAGGKSGLHLNILPSVEVLQVNCAGARKQEDPQIFQCKPLSGQMSVN